MLFFWCFFSLFGLSFLGLLGNIFFWASGSQIQDQGCEFGRLQPFEHMYMFVPYSSAPTFYSEGSELVGIRGVQVLS